MMMFISLFVFMGQMVLFTTASFDYAKSNFEALVSAYISSSYDRTQTIPRADQTTPLTVALTMNMYAILEFDVVAGHLVIVGSLNMQWTDNIGSLQTSSTFKPEISSVMIDYRKIWTPNIVLVNSMDSLLQVGDPAYKARFTYSTGAVTWNPRIILSASCSPDMTYYPFDQQTCSFIFTTWYHDDTMVIFSVGSDSWGLGDYDPNGVWDVESTSSRVYANNSNYYTEFTLIMKRKPLYFAFNIVLPVLLLSLLSGFVFILPVASGERIGFCVMCFLSFVVLLQTIMQFLPEASSPMSILCVYVIIMMLFTGFVTIVTILLIRVHLATNEANVPNWLIHVVELINCSKIKKCYANVRCRDENKVSTLCHTSTCDKNKTCDTQDDSADKEQADESIDLRNNVSWRDVGNLLDLFFILFFLGAQAAFSIFLLVPLGTVATN